MKRAQTYVLADAGYGIDYAFRQSLTDLGLIYLWSVSPLLSLWSRYGAALVARQ